MGTFGERLQRERELRGIALDDIADATKIGTRSLRALEEEQFDKLPGGIFNKGFVRAYARFLGINEEQAIADYLAASGEEDTRPATRPNDGRERANELRLRPERLPASDDSRLRKPITALLLLVFIIAALSVGSRRAYLHYRARRANTGSSAATAVPAPPLQPINNPNEAAPTPVPQTTPGLPPGMSVAPDTKSVAPDTKPGAVVPATTGGQTSIIPPEFTVLIRAREKSWISVKTDGKVAMTDTLQPGTESSFQARQKIVMIVGNPGGVDISQNGQETRALSDGDKPRTVVFTPDGIQP